MNPNRTVGPESFPLKLFKILSPKKHQKNAYVTYTLKDSNTQMVNVMIDLPLSKHFENYSNLVLEAWVDLLFSGTGQYTALQIARKMDFYGAQYDASYKKHSIALSFSCLNKYVDKVTSLFFHCIEQATFPVSEFEIYKRNKIEALKNSLEKTSFLVQNKLFSILFRDTPFDEDIRIDSIEKIDPQGFQDLHNKYFFNLSPTVFISGNFHASLTQNLFTHIEIFKALSFYQAQYPIKTVKGVHELVGKKHAQQSSIALGAYIPERTHDDFLKLQLLNMILGGYFGSRLMQNIREKKGFTYGIYSYFFNIPYHKGAWVISADIKLDKVDQTFDEINKEIMDLQKNKVSHKELDMVKMYMLGQFKTSFDNIFSHIQKFISVYQYGMDLSYYDRRNKTIENTQAEELLELSNKYLNFEHFVKINSIPITK